MSGQGWTKPSEVVAASGQKVNGRPRIDASRMNAWLKGERPKDPDMIRAAAETFGVPVEDVLRAADYLPPTGEASNVRPMPTTREAIVADKGLSEQARRMLLAAYDAAGVEDSGQPGLRLAARPRGKKR